MKPRSKNIKISVKLFLIPAAAFLLASCATTRLVSNSNGYDYNTNRDESLIKKQPDWLNKGMYQEILPDGNYYYVVGSYLGSTKEPNADKADIAESKAVIDAKTKVAGYLFSEVTTSSSDVVSETNQIKEITVNGKTSSVSTGEAYDSLYVDSYIKSAASFSGLVLNDRFFNLIEDTKENKRYYNYWCRFRISEENLAKAREEIEEKKSLFADERMYFAQLKNDCHYTIRLLQNTDFVNQEDQFKSLYYELVSLNSELRNLTYYSKQDLADQERKDYDNLIKRIAEILDEYDPSDMQKQQYLFRIRTLEQALQEKSGEAENLGAEITSLKNDYTGVVQNLEENIAQKNQEIEVAQQLVNTLRQEIATERATALQTRENEAVQQLADSLRQEIAANREATAQTRENTAIQQLAAALRQEFRKEQTESPRNQKDDAVQELVDSLREEIEDLQKNGIHLVSTNVFAVYPGKPEFTFSGEGFSLSSSAVTNREFVSYLTMTGTPDYSLAEEGLDNPVPRSFLDCVEYCNWLSRLYSLPEFYSVKNGAVQCNNNGGYRLPFEGELAEAASAGFSFPPEFAGLSLWSCTPSGTAGTLYRIENGTGEIRRYQTPAEGILACLVITRSKD